MHRIRWSLIAVVLFALAVGLAACSSDDTTSAGDTTAPLVVSTDPNMDDVGVGVGEDLWVTFNEDMDTESHTGNVTLTSGGTLTMEWSNARILHIEHAETWAEGVRVDVTVGTGVTDAAGNGLASDFVTGFWTESTEVNLLGSAPEDGASNVIRNTTVALIFSQLMNFTSLDNAISATADGSSVGYALSYDGDYRYIMTFDAALPASASIVVTVAAGAAGQGGATLASDASITFTTGSDLDTTPPRLLSVSPTNGSTISPDTPAFVMTFSEPMNTDSVDPTLMSAQFSILTSRVEPVWSENNTVMTVALPTPIPAGLFIRVDFEGFEDVNGNVQPTGLDYAVRVSGTADPYPFIDGQELWYAEIWTEYGVPGGPFSGDGSEFIRMEEQGNGDFFRRRYEDPEFSMGYGWDVLGRSSSQIQLKGFRDVDEGVPSDVTFSSPVDYLRLPVAAGSWNGSLTAPMDGMVATIDYTVDVLGQEDVPYYPTFFLKAMKGGPSFDIIWFECWKQVLTYQIGDGETVFQAGADTTWFAPGIGIVRTSSIEEDLMDGRSSESMSFLREFGPFDMIR